MFSSSFLQRRRRVFLTVSANTNNYDVKSAAGSPADAVEVVVNVNSGVTIGDAPGTGYGLRTGSSWNGSSRVWLFNKGTIQGKAGANGAGGAGGRGGNDSDFGFTPGAAAGGAGTPGTAGTPAMLVNVDTAIDNGPGTISGGAGGLGGGGGGSGGPGRG